jgi:hypothetical protein
MRVRTTVITVVLSSLLCSSAAFAQDRHVVDLSAMRQAIASQAATDQSNRDAVLGVLHRSEARELATRLGLDLTRAEGALSTLTSADLARLAGPARAAQAQLSGGDQIVMSLTTLLIIIIVVLLIAR